MVVPKYKLWYSIFHQRLGCKISSKHEGETKVAINPIPYMTKQRGAKLLIHL